MPVKAGMAPLEAWQSLSYYDPFTRATQTVQLLFTIMSWGLERLHTGKSTSLSYHTASAWSGDMRLTDVRGDQANKVAHREEMRAFRKRCER